MSPQLKDPGVHRLTLLERCAEGAVQAVLQVVLPAPGHDVREEVAVEGGVLLEQGLQVEGALGVPRSR